MTKKLISIDTAQPAGSQFPPAVQAELKAVATGTVTAKFQPMAKSLNPDVTLSVTQTLPSYAAIKQVPYGATNFAAKARLGMPWHTYAGNGFNLINGGTAEFSAYTSYEVEFYVNGQDVAWFTYSNQKSDYKFFVDDQPVTAGWQLTSAASGGYYLCLHFATAKVRKVRALMGINSLSGIFLPGASDIWAAPPRPRMAVIGDSFVQGPFSTEDGAIVAGSIGGQLAQRLGFEVFNLGQGGTGYVNPSSGGAGFDRYGAASRMAALAALPALDMILVFGGANDTNFTTYPEAATLANANTLWNAIKAARPSTTLVVAGTEPGTLAGFDNTSMDKLNTDLKAQALANPNVTAFIDMRTSPWVTGTGNTASPAGDGNADFFRSSDTIHPSHDGFDNIGERLERALRAANV